jgi:SAM-dependent methyltransferase
MAGAVMGLRQRALRPELMDDPTLDPGHHETALRGLERINWISRSTAIVWPPLRDLWKRSGRPMRVLDIACGGGDVTRGLARASLHAGAHVEVHGCDFNERAVELARNASVGMDRPPFFYRRDILNEGVPDGYDAVVSSLFFHHLTDSQSAVLLKDMARKVRLVVVNDLQRGIAGYVLAKAGCRLLSRSHVVRNDGPVSVTGAYTAREFVKLAASAGLCGGRITRHWPCRFRWVWERY